MTKRDSLEIQDISGLTDADWAEINMLRRAYESGGTKALSKALDRLAKDPIRHVRVMGAFFPDMVREAIKDQMAETGMTEDELAELIESLRAAR